MIRFLLNAASVIWFLLLIAVLSVNTETVCFDDAIYAVNLDTMAYVAPASTTTLKADLLKKYYQAIYERDVARVQFLLAVDGVIQAQDREDMLSARNETLWRVIFSTW